MIESLFILFIIFLFIIPKPTLALALGLSTSHLIYKHFLLLKNQPARHRRLVWYTLLSNGINLALSLALAFALSYAVFYFLTSLTWLFIFNFLFCFLVSARWFDFSHGLFRSLVRRISENHTSTIKTTGGTTFIMVYGLRKSTGWGAGLMPVFVDAGELDTEQEILRFKGFFLNILLEPGDLESAAAISSEQIIFVPRQNNSPMRIDRYKLVVRDQFYPFRCREKRDQLLAKMNPVETHSREMTMEPLSSSPPASG